VPGGTDTIREVALVAQAVPQAPEVPPALADLLLAGLDHGVDTVRGGDPLVPFVVTQVSGQRALSRMQAGPREDPRQLGVKLIRDTTLSGDDCAVLVYDGYLETSSDGRLDAVYAKGKDASGRVVTIAQRYKPKGFLRSWQPIGNPALVPNDGSDFEAATKSKGRAGGHKADS
jgi:hypothetical protein